MKCLILAAGYATRLYPLTKNFPKPLLKVKDKTIIDWIIDDLDSLNVIDKYYVVTNHRFVEEFIKWNNRDDIQIIDDGTCDNENRLGAVKDIDLAISSMNINDDLLIMAGDNLLDFSLRNYIEYFKNKKTSCVMRFYQEDINKLRRTGVAQIDDNDVIVNMEEKPKEPKSNWTIPPFYIIKKEDLEMISKAIKDEINVDAPGSFIAYLASKRTVHAFKMNGNRYDVGNLESYNQVNSTYQGIVK